MQRRAPRPPPSARCWALGLVVAGAGCDGAREAAPAEPAKIEAAASTPAAGATPAAAAPLRVPAIGEPGPAFLAIEGKGVVRVDEGTLTPLKNAPDRLLRGLQLGADGAIWISGLDVLYRLEGDTFREVTHPRAGTLAGSFEGFDVAADGQVWATTYRSVAHFDGARWSEESAQAIGAGDDSLKGIVVDGPGRVLVASTNRVHMREGGSWRELDLGERRGAQDFVELALAGDGSAYLRGGWAVLKIGPERGPAAPLGFGDAAPPSFSDLALAGDGSVGVVSLDQVLVLAPDGGLRRYSARRGQDFQARSIGALAVADGGRIWVATDVGVTILGPGGDKVEWPGGSFAALDGEIRDIVVLGAGPRRLPEAGSSP